MLDHQVIELPAAQGMLQIFKKRLCDSLVYRVEKNRLFVRQQVGVIGYAVRYGIDALEHRQPAVIRADPCQIIRYFSCAIHIDPPFIQVF